MVRDSPLAAYLIAGTPVGEHPVAWGCADAALN